ncbi:MAG: hypothetical protein ACFB14_27450 [Leptolyngbyaceae cyanobacterium]
MPKGFVEQLWGYDNYFSGRAVHPNWEWEDVLAGYGALANGLILNENALVVFSTFLNNADLSATNMR